MNEGNIEKIDVEPTDVEIDAMLRTLPYKIPFQKLVFKDYFGNKKNVDANPDQVIELSNFIREYILDHNNVEIRKLLITKNFNAAAAIMVSMLEKIDIPKNAA